MEGTTSLGALAWLGGAAVQEVVVGEVESDSNAQHEGGNSNQTASSHVKPQATAWKELTAVIRISVMATLIANPGI